MTRGCAATMLGPVTEGFGSTNVGVGEVASEWKPGVGAGSSRRTMEYVLQ